MNILNDDVTNVNMERVMEKKETEHQDGMLTFLVDKTAKTDGGTP